MLPLEEIIAFVESRVAAGESDMKLIEQAAFEHFRTRFDPDDAIRAVCNRRVSLAVVRMQNDDGERVAFSVKDADGTRRLAHMSYTLDRKLWLRISEYHAAKAREHQLLQQRTWQHAMQLELFAA